MNLRHCRRGFKPDRFRGQPVLPDYLLHLTGKMVLDGLMGTDMRVDSGFGQNPANKGAFGIVEQHLSPSSLVWLDFTPGKGMDEATTRP